MKLDIDQLQKDVDNKVIINKLTWHKLLKLAFNQRAVIATQKKLMATMVDTREN